MKNKFLYLCMFIVCLGFVIAPLYPRTSFAETCEQWVAKIVSVQGTVESRRGRGTQWQPVTLYDTYCAGDMIRVLERSRADIALVNQPVLRLDQNSTITLGGVKEARTSVIELGKGAVHFLSRVRRGLEVNTAFVNAGVEGTEFFVRVEEDRTFISVFEGQVLASNEAGNLTLNNGQSAVAEAGRAPELRIVVNPRDAVRWALYYPPIISFSPDDFKKGTEGSERVRKSLAFYKKGEIDKAFDSIDNVSEDIRDPRFFIYRASLLLTVGRVDEAGVDIQQSLSLDPNYSDALALQTIIAVVQNDKEKALNLAQKSVEASPASAMARIALSYAQQANFDLEGAGSSLEEAVKLEGDNALIWARLAEIHMSFGFLDKALKAARQAVSLDPDLSRTQTVLGFAYLIQVKTKQAKEAFEKAITLDQVSPLPRLGLGLAKIREGDLQGGRGDIEIAVSLDPNNSLIRSYLGKAYFEEKRVEKDGVEYATAKELDPNDPTPWMYDAIRKQTINRPVEALHDLQKAIELNDNRAVYRSKLQLDSDLAARSSSLAQIYNDLGFQQRGLVEGWNSVNTDPTDFSAHRFLADTYGALPRHEIARVSELLQSQLLQPININPIQPHLGESNLFLIGSGGAGNLSFNEFNPLFNSDQLILQANSMVGENSTHGVEGVISGIYKKASFSIGGLHHETDGFRTNADQDDDIFNAFFQLELTPKTSIQAEYRYRDNDRGDTQLRFFEDDFRPDRRQEVETKTTRLGFRHSFSPDSIIIGNFSYQKNEDDFSELIPSDDVLNIKTSFGVNSELDTFGGELQHLFRSKYISTIAGIGSFKIEDDTKLSFEDTLLDYSPPITNRYKPSKTESDINHYNLYLYSYINIVKNVTASIGVSGDILDRDQKNSSDTDLDEDQLNPKFGVVWNPVPNTTLRGAVFRTYRRTMVSDQTLEPTQVAGFNQFFDDTNGTDAWHYGAAVDQKFSRNIYGGAEFVYRDLEVLWFEQQDGYRMKKTPWEEYLGRAYLYWSPHNWLALKAEYRYERFERDPDVSLGILDVKTHSIPLGINFFHPSGLSAKLQTTYYHQRGNFQRENLMKGPFEHGKDNFWLVDAAISYRLPKRYGFITIGGTNLFDKSFEYAETDYNNPRIQPDRFIFCKLTLAFN